LHQVQDVLNLHVVALSLNFGLYETLQMPVHLVLLFLAVCDWVWRTTQH